MSQTWKSLPHPLPGASVHHLPLSQPLLQSIRTLIDAAREGVARRVNSTLTLTYFLIGRYIVEDEQQGDQRAEYDQETLKFMSTELSQAYGRGYSVDNLENMRRFYLAYQDRLPFAPDAQKSENGSRILSGVTQTPSPNKTSTGLPSKKN